jgi:hypothetical protein
MDAMDSCDLKTRQQRDSCEVWFHRMLENVCIVEQL